MRPPGWHTTWTLVRLDLLRLLRDPSSIVSVVIALGLGASVGLWFDWVDPARAPSLGEAFSWFEEEPGTGKDRGPKSSRRVLCAPAETPRILVHGDLPPGVPLPGTPLTAEALEVDLELAVHPGDAPLFRSWVSDKADAQAVNTRIQAEHTLLLDCLRRWRTEQSELELEALGIRERFGSVVSVHTPEVRAHAHGVRSTLAQAWLHADRVAILLATMGSVLGLALLVDTVPRTRQSGWEETLAALGVSPAHSSVALWSLAVVYAWILQGLLVLGHLLASPWLGWHLTPFGALGAVSVVPTAVAVIHLALANATDLSGAFFRMMVPLVALLYAPALLLLALPHWASVLAPMGGSIAVLLASPDALPLPLHLAAAGASFAWAALGVAWTARRFETRLHGAYSIDPVVARHSEGRFEREALALLFVGMWALFIVPGATIHDATTRFVTGQVFGLLGGALLVVYALPIDLRNTLSLRRPSWSSLATGLLLPALSIPLLLGMLDLQTRTLPWLADLDLTRETAQDLEELTSVLGGSLPWVVPGICEEVFFRGALLGLLLGAGQAIPSRGRVGLALFLQAAAFGAIHSPALRILPTATFGLLLGLLVLRSRSLWPAVVAHMIHNLVLLHVIAEAGPVDIAGEVLLATGLLALPLVLWGARAPEAGRS